MTIDSPTSSTLLAAIPLNPTIGELLLGELRPGVATVVPLLTTPFPHPVGAISAPLPDGATMNVVIVAVELDVLSTVIEVVLTAADEFVMEVVSAISIWVIVGVTVTRKTRVEVEPWSSVVGMETVLTRGEGERMVERGDMGVEG